MALHNPILKYTSGREESRCNRDGRVHVEFGVEKRAGTRRSTVSRIGKVSVCIVAITMQASAAYSWTLGLNEWVWGETNRGGGKGGWWWEGEPMRVAKYSSVVWRVSRRQHRLYCQYIKSRPHLQFPRVPRVCSSWDLIAIGPRSSAATCIIDRTCFAHVAAVTRGTATTIARTALSSSCWRNIVRRFGSICDFFYALQLRLYFISCNNTPSILFLLYTFTAKAAVHPPCSISNYTFRASAKMLTIHSCRFVDIILQTRVSFTVLCGFW